MKPKRTQDTRPVLRLIDCAKRQSPPVCQDTVAVCQELLRLAEEGRIDGLAFALSGAEFRHTTGLIGAYVDNPEGLAMVSVKLAHVARSRWLGEDSES